MVIWMRSWKPICATRLVRPLSRPGMACSARFCFSMICPKLFSSVDFLSTKERSADMNEEIQARLDSLREEYDQLLKEVGMSDVTEDLTETASLIAGLPGGIKGIRDAG